MLTKKNRITITVAVLLAFVAFVFGLFISQHVHLDKKVDLSQFNGTLLDTPREVKEFDLIRSDKASFTNASLKGHWTMLFFGFTNCGSICPTTMAELGKMYRLLQKEGVKELPQVIMISVDPERDTLKHLDQYVKAFDPHFYGARGSEEAISSMTKEMGIAYTKVMKNDDDSTNHDIEHTGTIMLFNPQGQLSAFFTTPKAPLLAKDYQLLVS
jgi:protein SCO1